MLNHPLSPTRRAAAAFAVRLPVLVALALLACNETAGNDSGKGADTAADPDTGVLHAEDSAPPEDTAEDTAEDTGEPIPWDETTDSDGDGLTDLEEGRDDAGSLDSDHDGIPDYLDDDSDDDGVLDAVEGGPRGSDGGPVDTDGDGTPDYLDKDSDGDGIPDAREGADGVLDTDGDGIADFRDEDSDDDGLSDEVEGTEDWDGDGIPNWRDATNDFDLGPLLFTAITTEFNSPIGIDFEEAAKTVVVSVNYSGGNPNALETILPDGTHAVFSSLSGVTDEVKIATVRSGGIGGFSTGELFVGNGTDGQIVRISADGSVVTNPWVDLPGDSNGLMRGSLYVDRTGVFAGELIVATTIGQVWRVDNAGVAVQIADLPGIHLEGLVTVPDAPARFGPLAGMILAGSENEGLMYAIAADGSVASYNVGVAIEDIDIVMPHENFFGVNYGTSRIVGVLGDEFLPIAGDILLTQETVGSVGLFRLTWNGVDLVATELQAAAGSATIGQWEHTTFAAAGINEVPD